MLLFVEEEFVAFVHVMVVAIERNIYSTSIIIKWTSDVNSMDISCTNFG